MSNVTISLVNMTPNLTDNMTSGGNFTMTRDDMAREYVSVISYLLLFIFGAPANLFVLIGMIRNTLKIKQEVRLLLINLAIADCIVMLIFVPQEIIWKLTKEWLAGDFECKLLSFIRAFGFYASSLILIAISLDRYFAIKNPMDSIDSERRIKIMLAIAWIISALLSLPQPFIWAIEKHPHIVIGGDFYQCRTPIFTESDDRPNGEYYGAIYNYSGLFPLYFIPLGFIIFSYSHIYLIVRARAHGGPLVTTSCSPQQSAIEMTEISRRRSSGEQTAARMTMYSELPEEPQVEKLELESSENNGLRTLSKVTEEEPEGKVLEHEKEGIEVVEQKKSFRRVSKKLSFEGIKSSEIETNPRFDSTSTSATGTRVQTARPSIAITDSISRSSVSLKADQTRKKVLRMTSLLIVTFVACWTPYVIVATYTLFHQGEGDSIHEAVTNTLYSFCAANSCINPYLYGNMLRFIRERRDNNKHPSRKQPPGGNP